MWVSVVFRGSGNAWNLDVERAAAVFLLKTHAAQSPEGSVLLVTVLVLVSRAAWGNASSASSASMKRVQVVAGRIIAFVGATKLSANHAIQARVTGRRGMRWEGL